MPYVKIKLVNRAPALTTDELLSLIDKRRLYDSGCGAVDVALLWTADRNLGEVARRLAVAFDPP